MGHDHYSSLEPLAQTS